MLRKIKVSIKILLVLVISMLLISRDSLLAGDRVEQVRAFTRMIEFDYVNWTLNALFIKGEQASLGINRYMSEARQEQILFDYLALVKQINDLQAQIEQIYADPNQVEPAVVAQPSLVKLRELKEKRQRLAPVCESILQEQISAVVASLNLTVGGEPIPPVLYHVTPLPLALIVSPRSVIRQDADISLLPDMTLDEIIALENKVEKELDVSALVEEIGGIGIYPTMVMSTTNLPWLVEVVSHEWTHNFLTLRPLGLNYETTAELRTMNETTANIAGKEIANAVLARFYPEYAPKPQPTQQPKPTQPQPTNTPTSIPEEPPAFNFGKEMHKTRVTVDKLLAEGKIEEAESYMEERRVFIWDNGYLIRRLNQAYFAFHGAYADAVGESAAGEDPVGPAVVRLRQNSSSLADFLNRISQMDSFDKLLTAIEYYQ
jgi:hypothetical protein